MILTKTTEIMSYIYIYIYTYAYPISSYHLFDFPLGDIFRIYPCYIYNVLLDIYTAYIYI